MKDTTLNHADSHVKRLHGAILSSWYRRARLFRKRTVKEVQDVVEEPVYDVERIRKLEYPLLQGQFAAQQTNIIITLQCLQVEDEIYLDHAGTTLFPRSAIGSFTKDITSNIFGNPHSESKSSRLSTLRVEETRLRALKFFNASPDEFDLVFVQNATAAIKLVSEILQSYSKEEGGFWYGYHGDSHTSLVGIREVARAGYTCFDRDEDVEEWIGNFRKEKADGAEKRRPTRLFAYPGQSNMTGRRLPVSWPGKVRKCTASQPRNTFTLLDAAALASTAELDLRNPDAAPDFTALSFYKIFGFPDLGALIVRRSLGSVLRRKYFGGGTVEMVVNGVQWHSLHSGHPHEFLEDGTLPFHNIVALDHAISAHERLYVSQKLVSRHTARLVGYLYASMASLRHANGSPVCVIYKDPKATYGDASSTGPTIAFNIRYADGTWVKLDDLEALAEKNGIHLRTGGVCNPGGIASALRLEPWEFLRNYVAGTRCGHGPVMLGEKPSGIARVSLGAMSSVTDVDALIKFVKGTFLDVLPQDGGPLIWTSGMRLRVSGVMVYPLDGAGAWRVPPGIFWPVEESGLRWDRKWFLVDLDRGNVLTREAAPRLVLLSPEIKSGSRALRVCLHDSLSKSIGQDAHLCLPLGGDDMQRPVCGSCATGELQMATRTVEARGGPVSARICASEDVMAFFSSALGVRCTVARMSDSTRGGTSAVQPTLDEHETIVVEDPAPRTIQSTGSSRASSTLVKTTQDNGTEVPLSAFGPESRSLDEALAEGMHANIILTQPRKAGHLSGEKRLFMAIGRHCSGVRRNPRPV